MDSSFEDNQRETEPNAVEEPLGSHSDAAASHDEVAAAVAADVEGAFIGRDPAVIAGKQQRVKRYLSIRWKVGGSFAILLLMTIIIGIVAVLRLFALQNQVNTLANRNLQVVEQSNALKQELLQMQSSMRGFLITGNSELLDLNYNLIKNEYPQTFINLESIVKGSQHDESMLNQTQQGFDAYVKYADGLIAERNSGQGTQAIESESAGQGDSSEQAATSGLDTIIQEYQQQAGQSARNLQRTVDTTIAAMGVLTAIAIVIGLLAGIPATLGTPRNINRVTRMLREIASAGGDLTKRIDHIQSRDEVSRLADATNQLLESIASLVSNIGRHSETLAASAEELSASTDETARAVNDISGTAGEFAEVSEQAVDALGELTASLTSVQTHGDETAARADNVASAVMNVSSTTERGQQLVEQAQGSMVAMQTMTERAHASVLDLNKSSEEIAMILGTIRSIADETNLLALNASIEAARAGDAGRGFAVVAQEVRHLAEQSRGATARINEIIGRNLDLMKQVSTAMEEGVNAVADGRQAFERTQEAFLDIRTGVQDVVPSMVDIVERSMTQKQLIDAGQSGVQKLNALMEQVAAGSENNAATSEETLATVQEIAASSHELARIAQSLQDAVGRFQV